MHEFVEGAVKAAGDALKNHPVKIDIAADIPLVKTDQALLQQALANILHNAAVYSPDGIARRNHRPPRRSKNSASPCATTARDCRPARRRGCSGSSIGRAGAPAGGTGLGLSIARGFVQALGGDIAGWNHPEGGAVFEILLKAEFMAQDDDVLVSRSRSRRMPT